jgi:hypothetical protein
VSQLSLLPRRSEVEMLKFSESRAIRAGSDAQERSQKRPRNDAEGRAAAMFFSGDPGTIKG